MPIFITDNAKGKNLFLRSTYAYDLPDELIAQTPSERRDGCRMLVVHRDGGRLEHRTFSDLPEYLRPGDCLVINDTKVIPARLFGTAEGRPGPLLSSFRPERPIRTDTFAG